MQIIGIIMTVIVFGLVVGIWIFSRHLDELTELFLNFLYLLAIATIAFLLFAVLWK